jgi:hypothetical protein
MDVLRMQEQQEVLRMWNELDHRKLKDVATENGMHWQMLMRLFDQHGLTGRQEADPGPDEILAATAVIRASWTPQQEKARWIAARRLIAG